LKKIMINIFKCFKVKESFVMAYKRSKSAFQKKGIL